LIKKATTVADRRASYPRISREFRNAMRRSHKYKEYAQRSPQFGEQLPIFESDPFAINAPNLGKRIQLAAITGSDEMLAGGWYIPQLARLPTDLARTAGPSRCILSAVSMDIGLTAVSNPEKAAQQRFYHEDCRKMEVGSCRRVQLPPVDLRAQH
jgi:hypothetical protein